ncbi:MAG: hypothetical protein GY778_09305 [bacterium]|nr:hypothetical protein [bacterium]
MTFVDCRFCYLAIGVDNEGPPKDNRVTLFNCYFGGNTADFGGDGAAQRDEINWKGTDTVTLAGSETNHGMVDPAGGDYNLDADEAANYSFAVELEP